MAQLKYILIVVLFLSIVHVAHASTLYTVPSQDASVNQYNHTVNYNGVYLYIGYDQNTRLYESLIEFDPETYISSNANITGANITMYVDTCGTLCAGNVPIRRFSGNWWESNVTWDTKPATSGIIGYINLSSGAGLKYTSTDITLEIQGIINGSYNNYGFSFIPAYTGPNNISYIHSGEGLTPQPSLNIEYWIPPSTPTISSPTGVTLSPINLTWNASTDIDGEAITYYYQIANDSSFTDIVSQGSTPNTYSGSVVLGNRSYYARVNASDAHGNSPWSSIFNFAVGYPALFYPTNGSTITSTFPPLTTNINFTWSQLVGAGSNLIVAKDSNFNLVVVDTTTPNNFSVHGLEANTYFWRVRYYNISSGSFYGTSETFTFLLLANATANGTGVHGTVYEVLSGEQTPVDGASVFIYNDTWSSTQIVGSNGYYLFTGLGGTYYIIASKDKYDNSLLQTINVTSGLLTQNILLKPETSPVITDIIYGTFTIKSLFGSPYSGVTVTLYKDDDLIAYMSGVTDSKGQAVFEMRKGQYYRVVLTGSVSMTTYVWGGEEDYRITIFSGFPSGGNKYDEITANLTVTTVNATYSNLTLIYSDSTSGTSLVNFYATNITTGNTCYQTSGVSVITLNCTILASGTYQFGFNATTSNYGFIQQDKIINFDVGTPDTPLVDIGVSTTYAHWISVILLILTAALFSGKYVRYGAVIVPLFGLGLWGIGWFNINILLVTIALCVGIMVYMRSSESKVAY